MERKLFIKGMALMILLPSVFIAACSNEKKPEAEAVKEKQQTFTCPMHPQIIRHEMGTCPICGMDLVPIEMNSNDKALKVDEKRQALANITTIMIGENTLSGAKQLNGRLVVNPEQSSYISSRIAGRVEQLYIRETGVKVSKGQPLYKLYSEQLATLQQEYLMAVAQEKQFQGDKIERQIVASAKQKLLLYGQSENQVQQLVKTQKKDSYVVFYAPESGVVAELSVTQGQYVAEGSPILRLEGYGQLWVEADVYPNEATKIKQGQKVRVVVAGWEGQPQEMTISFITPSLQSSTQLTQIRGSISNPGNQWQPGLQVNVFLPSGNKSNVLTLPVDAVIRDGKGMHVWVKSGKDSFEPRLVKTGTENDNQVEIAEGLKNGDQVVVTGAYLLYSEYILKKGKNPVEGLKLKS
ncbi:MAG: efflux RND transporter periplasmic adaptor subunit [Candidatus Pedobacter colombiensis]|uniref:Efflux RND transporter periplasmic adaptor subunit n=1 Tax=Candidatus Pedobacter colombiensis TaxID=3121371 RepID=A0AAJ5W6P7_9SPHI|nr:efflux RND transporter periplasmic adaptor subunit [Pedobacter sp.]WEK18133.1 MAG: efflux RND transporter periplasmic adaptor subunit [Pedobacter sp.]